MRRGAANGFIRQSWRSNYCGIYSTAMLLTLAGFATSRQRARRLFGLRPSQRRYGGSRLSEVARAALAGGLGRARWLHYSAFDPVRICAALARHAPPTILWFGIRHRRTGCCAKHFAVIVDAKADEIRLLDPLGKPPVASMRFNVAIPLGSAGARRSSAAPVPYLVAARQEAALLVWRR